MNDRQVSLLVAQADACRRRHDWSGAITLLKKALTIDAEHPGAHGSLALALLGARRVVAAGIESDLALAFDPNSAFSHYVAAAVKRAERKLDDAWQHVNVALQDDSADADAYVLAAAIRDLQGQADAARTLLDEALAIDPQHVDALVELGSLELEAGNRAEAHVHVQRALTIAPDDVDAHIVAGHLALAMGNVDEAEEHARFALGENAADRDALGLWTAVKARRNVVLGLWWRFGTFVSQRSERGQLALLIGSFLVVHLAIIMLGAVGYEDAEILLGRSWTAFCAFTWFAPEIFNWMLKRELESVVLRHDY